MNQRKAWALIMIFVSVLELIIFIGASGGSVVAFFLAVIEVVSGGELEISWFVISCLAIGSIIGFIVLPLIDRVRQEHKWRMYAHYPTHSPAGE